LLFSIFIGNTKFAHPLSLDTVFLCRSAVRFSDFLCTQISKEFH